MQYNTALGFVLCGSGLIFLNLHKTNRAGALGIIASSIGGITLIQYLWGVQFGIDELFIKSYILTKTSHPGRMAPNTALCFLLSGGALALTFGFINERRTYFSILEITGAIVTGLGAVALLGYIFELESAYGWGNLTRMAVHTATGFILLGLGLIGFSVKKLSQEPTPRYPFFIAVSLLVMALALWKALLIDTEKDRKELIRIEVNLIKSNLVHNIHTTVVALDRLKDRWENKLYKEKNWHSDAKNYIRDMPELLAVEWMDENHRIREVEPLGFNKNLANPDISSDEATRRALDTAKLSNKTVLTSLIQLTQREWGYVSVTPIFSEDKLDGFVLGIFSIKILLNSLLNQQGLKWLEFKQANSENISQEEYEITYNTSGRWIVLSKIAVGNLKFTIHGELDTEVFEVNRSSKSDVIGISGILLSLIFSTLIYFNAKINYQSRYLALEVERKHLLAEKLKSSEVYLSKVLSNISDGLIVADGNGIIQMLNHQAERMFGYNSSELIGKNVSILIPEAYSKESRESLEKYLNRHDPKISNSSEEIVAQKNNGSLLDLELHVTEMTWEGKKIFLGNIKDITEIKHTREELKSYRDHLEDLLEKKE